MAVPPAAPHNPAGPHELIECGGIGQAGTPAADDADRSDCLPQLTRGEDGHQEHAAQHQPLPDCEGSHDPEQQDQPGNLPEAPPRTKPQDAGTEESDLHRQGGRPQQCVGEKTRAPVRPRSMPRSGQSLQCRGWRRAHRRPRRCRCGDRPRQICRWSGPDVAAPGRRPHAFRRSSRDG